MLGRAVMIISAVAVSLMVIRGLNVVEFGQYVALLGLMLVLSLISDMGISRIQPRFLPELFVAKNFHGLISLIRGVAWARASLHGLILLLVWLLSPIWTHWLNINLNPDVLLPFIIYTFFYALNAQTQRTLQVLLMQKQSAKLVSFEWLLKVTLLFGLYQGADSFILADIFWIQAAVTCLAFIIGQGILWVKGNKLDFENETPKTTPENIKNITQFGLKNWLQSLMGVPLTPGAARLFIATFAGAISAAHLGFAYTMMQLMQRVLPSKMIMQAIEPVYIARYRESGDFKELNNMASLVLKLNYFILLPLLVWFPLGSAGVLDWVSAGKYSDAGWIVAALIFIFMLENHRMALQVLSNAVDQSWLLVKSNFWANVLLPFYIGFIALWDIMGLLVGLAMISAFRNTYLIHQLRKNSFNYLQDWAFFSRMILSACFATAALFLLTPHLADLSGSLISLATSAFIFYASGLLFKFFNTQERALMNKTLGKKLFFW